MKKSVKAFLRQNSITKPAIDQLVQYLQKGKMEKIKSKKAKGQALGDDEIQFLRVAPWIEAQGDTTLRLNYALDKNSVVFDMGGYEGAWANDIYNKYGSNIYVFEPFPAYAANIKKRFEGNPKVRIFDFGLSSQTNKMALSISDDASSLFRPGENTVDIQLKNAAEFLRQNNIDKIDLIKINIEGGEYDLLDHLIETGFTKHIGNIQVQFHDFIMPDCVERMKKIQNHLELTHRLTYQFEFVWENWELKSSN